MNLFKFDGPIYNGLSRIFDILFLNILWLLCSIPIITIGASTTALYYCMLKISRKNDAGMAAMFFKSFRQNFKQGCALTVVFAVSGVILYMNFQACALIEGIFVKCIKILIVALLIVFGLIVSYAFPLLAQFDNTVKNTLKNSLLLAISNIKKTIPIFIINAIPIVVFWKLPYTFVFCLPLLLTFGVALIAFINSKILIGVFDKYIQS